MFRKLFKGYNMSFIRGRVRKNIILVKLFLGILGISALTIIIFSVLIFDWFRNNTIEDVNNSNIMALSNINSVMSNYLDSTERIALELFENTYVKELIYSNNDEWSDNRAAVVREVSNILSVNPYIGSIYIVGKKDILLKASNSTIPEDYENITYDLLKKSAPMSPTPWVFESYSGRKKHMMSVFIAEGGASDKASGDAIVVTLNMDVVYDSVFAAVPNTTSKIFIMDREGTVFLDKNEEFFGTSISGKDYIQEILEGRKNSGSYTINLEDIKYSVNFNRSNDSGLYAVQLIPYHLNVQKLTEAGNFTLTLCIIFLLCIIIVSLIISLRIYNPIRNVFRNIRNLFVADAGQPESNMDEIQLVSSAAARIINKMNSYEKELENKAAQELFSLSDRSFCAEEVNDFIKKMKITSDTGTAYCIIILRICGYKEFLAQNTARAIDFQINSICGMASDLINRYTPCNAYAINNEHVVLLAMEKGDFKLDHGNLRKPLADTCTAIFRILGLEVTAGASGISTNLGEIVNKYREAYELTKYRLFLGKTSVITPDELILKENNDEINYYIEKVLETARKNSADDFEYSLTKLITICRSLRYEKTLKLLSQLAVSILKIPEEASISNKNLRNPDYIEIYRQIEVIETLENLKGWFLELYKGTSDQLSDFENTSVLDVVTNAVKYIDENYNDTGLTANLMAEKLCITPSYFSRVFNEHIGTSFPDYINTVRLENAKKLLLENQTLGISEICARVGYNNASYFTSAFRKKYGITPSKYRLNYLSSGVIN